MPKGSPRLPAWGAFVARFWAQVDRNGPVIRTELGQCWIWTGGKSRKGYGVTSYNRRQLRAARVALELTTGVTLGDDVQACHRCDNPPCVRPGHLFPGTAGLNQADKVAKGRAAKGETNGGGGKLTAVDVLAIRAVGRAKRQAEVGDAFGVSQVLVGKILRRELWAHVK